MGWGQRFYQLARELVGFAAGGAVTHGNQFHAMLLDQLGEHAERLVPAVLRRMGVDRCLVNKLTGGVDHRYFTAGAQAGV